MIFSIIVDRSSTVDVVCDWGLFSLYSLCSTMFSMVVEEWFARCRMACATVGGVFGGMAIQQSSRWTELTWSKWRAFISDSVEIVGVAGLSGLKSGRIHCMMCTLKFNDQRHSGHGWMEDSSWWPRGRIFNEEQRHRGFKTTSGVNWKLSDGGWC